MAGSSSAGVPDGAAETSRLRTPACLMIGMAGSGKTTLVDALCTWLENEEELMEALGHVTLEDDSVERDSAGRDVAQNAAADGEGVYIVNLDPAVLQLPYDPNVDIRDTIKYKDVMREYSLGPNGAIITSLNLFATRFDQVLSLVEKRAPGVKAVLFDTPGQIETFTWSASGAIITESLAMVMPAVVIFVVDTMRSESAMTFVSNMLYACSIMYKTRLPMIIAFNKIDVSPCKFAQAWMKDFDAFDDALKEENFVGTLARSMAQALEEFYETIPSVGVSAATGEGMPELFKAIQVAAKEYERDYRPALEKKKRERAEEERQRVEKQMGTLRDDVLKDRAGTPSRKRDAGDRENPDDGEEKKAYEDFARYVDSLNTSDAKRKNES